MSSLAISSISLPPMQLNMLKEPDKFIYPRIESATKTSQISNYAIEGDGTVSKDWVFTNLFRFTVKPTPDHKISYITTLSDVHSRERKLLSYYSKGRRIFILCFTNKIDPNLGIRNKNKILIVNAFAYVYGSSSKWVVTVIRNNLPDQQSYDQTIERTMRCHWELRWESAIAPIKAYHREGNGHWIVQHHYPDGTLQKLFVTKGIERLDAANVLYLVFDVWNAICKLHENNWTHNKINRSSWIAVKDMSGNLRIKLGNLWHASKNGDTKGDMDSGWSLTRALIGAKFSRGEGESLMRHFSKVGRNASEFLAVARALDQQPPSRPLEGAEDVSAKRIRLMVPVETDPGEEKADH